MKFKNEFILRYSAVLVLAAGLFWTAINILRADDLRQRMKGKLETVKQLLELKGRHDSIEASFNALANLPSSSAPALATLASSSVTGSVAEIRDLDARTLGRGWSAKRAEVTFREVNLNSIADFLHAAETQRPPWRLAECVITTSQKADGYGTAVLTLETLVKTGAGQ